MSEFLAQDEEEAALERIVRNQLAIAELQEENELLKGFFKARPDVYVAGGSKITRGKFYIKVSTNSRINDELARAHLDPTMLKRVSKTVVDSTLARRVLPEATLDKITKKYDNRIEIGLN